MRRGFFWIEVFGKRSKAGIWKAEARKSFNGVRDVLEIDIIGRE